MPTEREKLLAKYMTSQSTRDALDSLSGKVNPRVVLVQRTAAQTIGHGSWVSIFWDTEVSDELGWFDPAGATTRITIANYEGWVDITGTMVWASIASGLRNMRILQNGSVVYTGVSLGSGFDTLARGNTGVVPLQVSSGDYIEMQVFQDSGGALSFSGQSAHNPYLYVKKLI